MLRFVLCLVFLCLESPWLGVAGGRAGGWEPSDVPSPMSDPEGCGRPGVSRSLVCDPDDLLTVASADTIEGYINGMLDHAQVAVLVIQQMGQDTLDGRSVEAAAEFFARAVHDRWGVGDRTQQDGILVFLSVGDRAVFISTGDGAGRTVTGKQIARIIKEMRPKLRAADWGQGLQLAVVEIGLLIGGGEFRKEFHVPDSRGSPWRMPVVFAAIFCGIMLCGFPDAWKDRRLARGQQAMQSLMNEVSESTNRYHATSCPICLEDFPGAGAGLPAQRPMALRCGHVFCWQCLDAFLKTAGGDRCPVCRQPAAPDGAFSQDYYQTSESWFQPAFFASQGYTNSMDYRRWRYTDLQYRMGRMRTLYPEVMTDETYQTLNAQLENGTWAQFREAAAARHAEVARIITERAAQAQKSGSGGSRSSSFGGGRSSGGGGGRF